MLNWLENTSSYTVDPSAVDLNDRTYCIPRYASLATLVKSIESVGILNAPVLQKRASGSLVPVLGRRRIKAAVELGISRIEARLVPVEMPEDQGFSMAFWDNVAQRTLGQASVAVVTKRLLDLFPRTTVAKDFLPVLGIPPRGPRLERLCAIAGLEEPILEALALGRVHERTALVLAALEPAERALLFDATETLGLNANKRAEVVENLFDLAVHGNEPVHDLLSREEVRRLLAEENMLPSERAERFRKLVHSWKFPELVKRETEFRDWSSTLPGSERLSVNPRQSFETPEVTLEIRADCREDAERMIKAIKDYLA